MSPDVDMKNGRPQEPSGRGEQQEGTSGQRREEIRDLKKLWEQRIKIGGGDLDKGNKRLGESNEGRTFCGGRTEES